MKKKRKHKPARRKEEDARLDSTDFKKEGKMTYDKNGRLIQCGDIVKIENAFFKNDNGYWWVEQDGSNPAYSGTGLTLTKIGKRGKISTAKHNLAFWPLTAFCSDHMKNAMAHEHNRKHATIEITTEVDNSEVIAWIRETIKDSEETVERDRLYGQGCWAEIGEKEMSYFKKALERLEAQREKEAIS